MSDNNSSVSNKKNAGKGNGNSIIKNTSTNDTSTNSDANNYVSADAFPTSTGHKFGASNEKEDDELE